MATSNFKDQLADRLKDISFNPHRRGSEPIGRIVCTCDQLCSEHKHHTKYSQLLDLNHPYYPFPYNAPETETSKCHGCKRSISEDDKSRRGSVSNSQIYLGRCPSCHFRIRRDTCPETKSALSVNKATENSKHRRAKRPSDFAVVLHSESPNDRNGARTPTVMEETCDEQQGQVTSLRSLISEVASSTVTVEKELLLASETNCKNLKTKINSLGHANGGELRAEREALIQEVSTEHSEIISKIEMQLKRLREKVESMDQYVCTVLERDAGDVKTTSLAQKVDDVNLTSENRVLLDSQKPSKKYEGAAKYLPVDADIYSFNESDDEAKCTRRYIPIFQKSFQKSDG